MNQLVLAVVTTDRYLLRFQPRPEAFSKRVKMTSISWRSRESRLRKSTGPSSYIEA
jgi:hypothetical protein